MREFITIKVMDCTRHPDDSQNEVPQQPSGLCEVCQKIDFISLTSKACPRCFADRRFHIGSLQDVSRKTFCPGCRLILSAVRATDHNHDLPDETTITIQRQYLVVDTLGPADNLPEATIDNKNVDRPPVLHAHWECFSEVILNSTDEDPIPPQVAGTIIRIKEAQPEDSHSPKGMVVKSEGPAFRARALLLEVNLSLLKQWIQSCKIQHKSCSFPALVTSREHSIRLIDVQDRRIVPATTKEKYVALSYVWGPTTIPSLARDKISECLSIGGFKKSAIPQTIIDAIELVKCIGMRYLWVDSLCIVQDDDNDKQQQLKIMGTIYNNAELLVVAATGGNANAGLPGIGNTPRRISQSHERIAGSNFISVQPLMQRVLKRSVWKSRGWTFQEAMLSKRALIFTESLVYWSCHVDSLREDISIDSGLAEGLNETNSLWPHLFGDERVRTCRTFFYCQLVNTFSGRTFKEGSDAVWAFVGILRLQASHFQRGFIWGLPYERLDATLLWSEIVGCPNSHLRQASHVRVKGNGWHVITYPSWSWF